MVGIVKNTSKSSSMSGKKEIVVIGAGVIGLSAAVKAQESEEYQVTIVAEILPQDPKSTRYTSHWAGAHHVSQASKDVERLKIDEETFRTMWELSSPGNPAEKCFLRIHQHELECGNGGLSGPYTSYSNLVEKDISNESNKPHPDATNSAEFDTLTIDTPVYLPYLFDRFTAAGGKVVKASVQHINQIAEGGTYVFTKEGDGPNPPDGIIVCAGLGARSLGGVEDSDVIPIRGQTVILRAPWVKSGITLSSAATEDKEEFWTYVIPRRSGDVVVGGTKGVNDWYPLPRPEAKRDILERCLALFPILAPPEVRAERAPTVEDLEKIVVGEGCGFRPYRKGGPRIDSRVVHMAGKKIPIVHNYGDPKCTAPIQVRSHIHSKCIHELALCIFEVIFNVWKERDSNQGAGVVGLTTAIKAQESGEFQVTIVAESLPQDPMSSRYTSHWAGAQHAVSSSRGAEQLEIDQGTFQTMWELSAPGSAAEHCFLRIRQEEVECGNEGLIGPYTIYDNLVEKDLTNETDKPHPEATKSFSFDTLTIDTPVYLPYLFDRFTAAGGKVVKASVQHINQIAEGGTHVFTKEGDGPNPPDSIIVCAGLGARSLGGVEDPDVIPARGQTVILKAPWVKSGHTVCGVATEDRDEFWTYVIPRRSGDVIVGGIQGIDDWYPIPRPETRRDILERCLAAFPFLAPPEVRAERTPTIDDLEKIVVGEGCGFRPYRKGGRRLDTRVVDVAGKKIPVVHNYGHGGSGFSGSWGSATKALELLKGALKQ